jgi:hypothetical protein
MARAQLNFDVNTNGEIKMRNDTIPPHSKAMLILGLIYATQECGPSLGTTADALVQPGRRANWARVSHRCLPNEECHVV